jgi:hypothetical protein
MTESSIDDCKFLKEKKNFSQTHAKLFFYFFFSLPNKNRIPEIFLTIYALGVKEKKLMHTLLNVLQNAEFLRFEYLFRAQNSFFMAFLRLELSPLFRHFRLSLFSFFFVFLYFPKPKL